MIVPAKTRMTTVWMYADSSDAALMYVDVRVPAPVHTTAARTTVLPNGDVYITGEVRFGAADELKGDGAQTRRRLTTVPWEPSPVFVWMRHDGAAPVDARGTTSGYGVHNAVFNATSAPLSGPTPMMIAGELFCRATLAGSRCRGSVPATVVEAVIAGFRARASASWTSTVGEVLLDGMRAAIREHAGESWLATEAADPDSAGELHDLALMECAHRIAAGNSPPLESLAMPAVAVPALTLARMPESDIDWRPGSAIPVRALRSIQATV